MCSNYIVDAKFALLLIQSLKEMLKTNGLPFIRNGVTLPFLAYAYKRLNCDDSPITEEYIRKIINSLDSAKDIKFIYQHCSEICEDVISQQTKIEDRLEEQGYYTRSSELTMLYDPRSFEKAPSSEELYKKYKEIMLNNTFSRVWKECKYDWDIISEEENAAINKIINNYKSKLNNR